MPQLSVDEIKKVLAEGGSVFITDSKGVLRHVTDPNRLPTEAELAKGDEVIARRSLDFSRDVGGFKPEAMDALAAKVASLIVESQGRADAATKELEAKVADLKAQLAAAKPAPAPTVPTPSVTHPAPAPVAPKPAEVKK